MANLLDKTFKNILKKYGHNIILQRRIVQRGKGIYSLPDSNDFYSTELERWTVRTTYAGRKTGLTAIQAEDAEGLVHTVKYVFYFPPEAKPNEGDRIYEPDDRFPPGNYTTFMIDYSHPVRGFRGAIVYFEVGVTRETPL